MPCITIHFLASSTRSYAYFTVQITCLPIFKFPHPSKSSLVRYLLYKWNRIRDKQHPCLSPLPVFTLLVSTWSSYTLTPCFMYCLLIILLLCQSVPVSFRMCINLVQLTCSSVFCPSTKEAHSSLFMSKVDSDIILSIPIASIVPFSSKSNMILSKYILNKYVCMNNLYPGKKWSVLIQNYKGTTWLLELKIYSIFFTPWQVKKWKIWGLIHVRNNRYKSAEAKATEHVRQCETWV